MTREKFLKEQKILRLATIGKEKLPHIVPVWYIYSKKKFYIGTNTRTRKAKNLKKNPNVAFCIDKGINAPDIFGVMGQAKARLILNESMVKKIAKKILLKYFKTLKNKSARELLDDTDCIIEISPKKITTWSY